MKFRKIGIILTVALLTVGSMTGCSDKKTEDTAQSTENDQDQDQEVGSETDTNVFRPADCGMQSQEEYEFPFLGLNMKLSQNILDKLNSRELFAFTDEDYTAAGQISYATIRYSVTTEEQRNKECLYVDMFAWEETLEKVGAIGMYRKDVVSKLDEFTACDTHEKIAESEDGEYEYYVSTNSAGNKEMADELQKTEFVFSGIHEIDLNEGYTAFSMNRVEGVTNIGTFETKDVNGKTYTEDVFKDYDLTLVNVFATWCSPCVEEMPELEALRKEYADKGIKLGIVGVVMDTKTTSGVDEGAVERAQALAKNSGANFPFLMPDDGEMNGRLTGIQAYPETFFVDKDGNIVSEAYVGARTQEDWSEIVKAELEK